MGRQCGEVVSIEKTDGLRVTLESDEIVHLRPSGNAPELRCYAEAVNAERAGLLCSDCLKHILELDDSY
jgi:phosphomannomutase